MPASRFTLLALLAFLGAARVTYEHGDKELRFQEGSFKVVQLTDMHYGEDLGLDEATNKVQATVIEQERAHLIVFSGDLVSGFASDGSPVWLEQAWRRAVQPALSAGVPWAAILGNHDREADASPREILDIDRRVSNLSQTQQGPAHLSGAGNYYLDIYEAQGDRVAARIWMLDSGRKGCENVRHSWGCVGSDVVAWVEETAAKLPPVPTSLAFIHIPLPQFLELWNTHTTNGTKAEPTGCPMVDTGVFETLRATGIQAIYSGHDHNNDYCGTLDGVRLAYGRKTGLANYGPPPGVSHGARVIELRQGQSAAVSPTWIRRGDGAREDQASTPAAAKAAHQQDRCAADPLLLELIRGTAARAAQLVPAGLGAGLVVLGALLLRRRADQEAGSASKGGRRGWGEEGLVVEEEVRARLCPQERELSPLGALVSSPSLL